VRDVQFLSKYRSILHYLHNRILQIFSQNPGDSLGQFMRTAGCARRASLLAIYIPFKAKRQAALFFGSETKIDFHLSA
jgi:hypothetical protein